MENPDEVLQLLERFTRLKQKEIPRELEDYLRFVARTGDTVYPWAAVKYLFREKLNLVIADFHDNTPSIADLPQCPNVDPFCYERMRRTLLGRMESFNSAPFTIQRICELLNEPRRHYTRIDKFMRAVEKNILVVSTQEPGRRRSESENGDSLDSIVNGDLEVNVDIEMDNEAFGIDSNEIQQGSSSSSSNAAEPSGEAHPEAAASSGIVDGTDAVASTSSSAVETEVPSAVTEESGASQFAKQEVEKQEAEPIPEAADVNETAAVDEMKPEESAPVVADTEHTESTPAAEDKIDSNNMDEANIPPEAAEIEPVPEIRSLDDEKSVSVPSIVDQPASDSIDGTTAPLVEQTELTDVAEKAESHDTIEPTAEDKLLESAEADLDDDGQPRAKMAKLSQDDPEPETPQQLMTTVESTESIDSEKDTVSSDSTTESGGSLVSIESESASSSSAETLEVASNVPTATEDTTVPSATEPEILPAQVPQPEVQPVPLTEAVPSVTAEVPTTPIAAETIETVPEHPVESEIKSQDDLEPQPAPVIAAAPFEATDEMAENVMATDEEEQLLQDAVVRAEPAVVIAAAVDDAAVDSVVPMAAELSEASKPDDNAMDIDESSVEPMDQ